MDAGGEGVGGGALATRIEDLDFRGRDGAVESGLREGLHKR